MKKNLNIFATLVLITGLMAPTEAQAAKYVDVAASTGSASLGWSLGGPIGTKFGNYIANLVDGHEGKILIAGIVGIAAYYIYTNRDQSSKQAENNRRPRSCANKGCSHKKCK